jgi:hypothetical protein
MWRITTDYQQKIPILANRTRESYPCFLLQKLFHINNSEDRCHFNPIVHKAAGQHSEDTETAARLQESCPCLYLSIFIWLPSEFASNLVLFSRHILNIYKNNTEVEITNVFPRCRVDSRSLRSTLSYKSTLMESTDNLSKPPDFFCIQTVTKDEWTCLYKIIN